MHGLVCRGLSANEESGPVCRALQRRRRISLAGKLVLDVRRKETVDDGERPRQPGLVSVPAGPEAEEDLAVDVIRLRVSVGLEIVLRERGGIVGADPRESSRLLRERRIRLEVVCVGGLRRELRHRALQCADDAEARALVIADYDDDGVAQLVGPVARHAYCAVELDHLADRPLGIHQVRLLVDVRPFHHEEETALVPAQHPKGAGGHLVEHRLIGRVVIIHHAVPRGVAPLGDLVQGDVHVPVSEEPDQPLGRPDAAQLGGSGDVGEPGLPELCQQVAAFVDRPRRYVPGRLKIFGQRAVVVPGGAARAMLPLGQEPAAPTAHQHREAGIVPLVEVLVDDACSGVAVAGVHGVRGGSRVLDVCGGNDARGGPLHPVQVLGHVLDARVVERVRHLGRVDAFLPVLRVVARRVARHPRSGIGHDAVERVRDHHARAREAVHRQVAVRIAAGRSKLDEARGGAVRDAQAVAEHDDDVARPGAASRSGRLDDERGRCRGGPPVVAHLCGDGVVPRSVAGEAAQVEAAVEAGSGERDPVGGGGWLRPLRTGIPR